jgi:D-alanine-D-alanine ligase
MRSPTADLSSYCVWVLAPQLETEDPNLAYYYDFSQSIQEYTRVFGELSVEWKWQPVTISNFKAIIQEIVQSQQSNPALVLNLCDGDEVNGAPGVSVIDALEEAQLIYTGANRHFYTITTSKIPMKTEFDKAGVSNASWCVISGDIDLQHGICERLGAPLIIKPAVSGGSMGVSIRNVVTNDEELRQRVEELSSGYRGWNLQADGLFVEQFIAGPEYTTFITGSYDDPQHCRVYTAVERKFHSSLPEKERFLSFDRLWEIYEDETPMPARENFYEYTTAPINYQTEIQALSLDAYKALKGKGYTRIDIRQDERTGKMYVLEANAQCGLSEDEDYTSIGAILKASGVSFTEVVVEILKDALRRKAIMVPTDTTLK